MKNLDLLQVKAYAPGSECMVTGFLNKFRGITPMRDVCNLDINGGDYYVNRWDEKVDTDCYGVIYKIVPETVMPITEEDL